MLFCYVNWVLGFLKRFAWKKLHTVMSQRNKSNYSSSCSPPVNSFQPIGHSFCDVTKGMDFGMASNGSLTILVIYWPFNNISYTKNILDYHLFCIQLLGDHTLLVLHQSGLPHLVRVLHYISSPKSPPPRVCHWVSLYLFAILGQNNRNYNCCHNRAALIAYNNYHSSNVRLWLW